MNKLTLILLTIITLVSVLAISGCGTGGCPEPEQCDETDCPVCECSFTEDDCPESFCPACPEVQDCEAKTVTVKEYVCPDGSVKNTAELCFVGPDFEFTPVTTNEAGTVIDLFEIKPSCIYGENGGTIKYELGSIASSAKFQVKEKPTDTWKTLLEANNVNGGSRTFVLVDETVKYPKGDFTLDKGKAYLFRVEFFIPGYNEYQYSNEHIIDGRSDGTYLGKNC